MNKIVFSFMALVLVMGISTAAHAEGDDLISFGIGYYDVLDDEGAVDFRAEYRPHVPVLIDELRPWLGAEVTSDGSIWAGAGLLLDIHLQDNWHLIPATGVGLYAQGGSDLDLGHAIEFRSQIELAYEFETKQMLGVSFGHLSNASIDDRNPGTEVLNVYWHMPY